MPTYNLTDASILRLKKPVTGRVEYWDKTTRGLGLRISSSGTRSWVLITRSLQAGEWKQQRVTLGTYPTMTLAEARKTADGCKATAKAGDDPAAAIREERQAMVDNSRNTFAVVREDFLLKYRGRQNRRPAPSTLKEMTNALAIPAWEERPLAKISKRDVLDHLDEVMERGAETMANRILAYFKLLFGWSVQRGIITDNPTDGIKKPGTEVSRDRVLTADELRLVWQATSGDQTQFNSIVRLLMLTGQRLREVTNMAWSEIDTQARTWTLQPEVDGVRRTKNQRLHVVPLTEPMLTILEARKAAQKALVTADKPMPKFVFSTTGTTPFSGFSRGKALLDNRISKLLAKANPEADPTPTMAPWRLHDLRRSLATHLAEDLRIAPHIIESVLNHISGSKAGVAGIYNRAQHLDERRDALEAWSRHLLTLVGEAKPDNVVELAARRA